MAKRIAILVIATLPLLWSGCGDDSPTSIPTDTPSDATGADIQVEEEGDVLFPVLDTVPGPKESDGDTGAGEGLETLDGDTVEEPSEDATAPVVPLVVITELMINPETVDDGDGEWIELTNLESEPVDLQGWILRDQGAGGHVFEESFVLNPGETVVLGANGDEDSNGGVSVDYVYPYADFILANGADEVILEVDGLEVDGVRYATDQGWPVEAGKSLSLKPEATASSANDGAESWCAAPLVLAGTEPGSPGLPNPSCDALPESDCTNGEDDDGDLLADCEDPDCALAEICSPFQVGSLVIAEVMANPAALSDGEGEWFEVYNASNEALDLRGLTIRAGESEGHLVAGEEPLLVEPGGVFVVEASADATEAVGYVWGPDLAL